MNVHNFSQKTKLEAEDLLKQGNVLEVLSKYGEVIETGAYRYDLMWGPDIDITILTSTPEESSKSALLEFIEQRNFQKYQFGDFITFPREDRPEGIIVVLIQEYQGRKWEVEIWFKKTLSESEKNIDTLLTSISDEQRKAILELKHQRETRGISKNQLNSAAIYRGVLSEGKVSIEDY